MTTAAIDTRDAVSLALVLADVLGPGLPVPGCITLHPEYFGSQITSAVSFQFRGPGSREAVTAWADLPVKVSPDSHDPSRQWHSADFTHLANSNAADQRIHHSRRCPQPTWSAICPCARGPGGQIARTGLVGAAYGPFCPVPGP